MTGDRITPKMAAAVEHIDSPLDPLHPIQCEECGKPPMLFWKDGELLAACMCGRASLGARDAVPEEMNSDASWSVEEQSLGEWISERASEEPEGTERPLLQSALRAGQRIALMAVGGLVALWAMEYVRTGQVETPLWIGWAAWGCWLGLMLAEKRITNSGENAEHTNWNHD